MAFTTASIDLTAPPDHVWRLIGGFDSLPDWLPFIRTSTVTEGGRIRHLTTTTGDQISERLESFDEDSRTYTYTFLQSPFPVTNYHATLTVHETPDPQKSQVEWSATFTPTEADDDAVALVNSIFTNGLNALKQTLDS
ncbi:SRPBCC family protein [Sphaerisporangium aureirubrum]|uniref:SRPBCC family protein n=1 Tax=Sphaerisporangium aureirubrum TaxID=1544736 RepID=A0ABW1NCR6_9ACTN